MPPASENPDGHAFENLPPALPFMKIGKAVRTHKPDQVCPWRTVLQFPERVCREERSKTGFNVRNPHTRIRDHVLRSLASFRHRRRKIALQGIARRDEPPNLIQPKPLQGPFRNVGMPRMRRIERTSQQSNLETGWKMPAVDQVSTPMFLPHARFACEHSNFTSDGTPRNANFPISSADGCRPWFH